MIVGVGDDPALGEYERLLLSMKTTARKELILLHPERVVAPGTTREWLKVSGVARPPRILDEYGFDLAPPMGSPTHSC